jgi:hypothetical protein
LQQEIKAKTDVVLVLVVNADYVQAIDELRAFAAQETKELKSPVMRFLQIEEWSRKNAAKSSNKPIHPTAFSGRVSPALAATRASIEAPTKWGREVCTS